MREKSQSAFMPALFKYLVLAVFVALLISRAAGFRASATPFDEMAGAVLQAADLAPMQEGDNQMIRRLYKLDPEEYDGVLLYHPTDVMGAEELFLVRLADASQAEAVQAAVESRLASQLNTFEGYGPDQVAMLERAVVEVRGNYVLFVSAEDPDAVRRAFEGAL